MLGCQPMELIQFKENIQISYYDPLKNQNNTHDNDINPVAQNVCMKIELIVYFSAIEEIKELHQDKGREDKSEMTRVNMIFQVVI